MRKKGVFHCAKCESPCTIYKKGKGHRVLVCPSCGVIASNPIPLLAAAAAPTVMKYAKKALKLAPALAGGGSVESTTPTSVSASYPPAQFYKNRFTSEERINLALR